MKTGGESHPPSILFPFQSCTALISLSKSPSPWLLWKWTVMMTSNKQESVPCPSTRADNNLYPQACTSCLYTACSEQDEPPHVCPASPSFVSLLKKNERFAWVLQPGWELGNAILFHLLQVAETRLLDSRKKIHLLPFPWGRKLYLYMYLYIYTSTPTHMNVLGRFLNKRPREEQYTQWIGLVEKPDFVAAHHHFWKTSVLNSKLENIHQR